MDSDLHPLSKEQTKSVLNSADPGSEHTRAACNEPIATAVGSKGEGTVPGQLQVEVDEL